VSAHVSAASRTWRAFRRCVEWESAFSPAARTKRQASDRAMAKGRLSRKMALQLPRSMSQPPITGPIAPIAAPVAPKSEARPLDHLKTSVREWQAVWHEHRGADALKQSARQQGSKSRRQRASRGRRVRNRGALDSEGGAPSDRRQSTQQSRALKGRRLGRDDHCSAPACVRLCARVGRATLTTDPSTRRDLTPGWWLASTMVG